MTNVYVSSVAYAAATAWSAGLVVAAGGIVRQSAGVAVGSERCFRTALGGTTGGSQPTWDLSKGAAQPVDNTITDWIEVTGSESLQVAGAWRATYARTGSAHALYVVTGTVGAGGTGYTLNDLLTLSTGTAYGSSAQFRATGVSGGVVTALTKVSGGSYRIAPNATSATTGGTGTGCTIANTTAQNVPNGNDVCSALNHAATQGTALALTLRGSTTSPVRNICVDHTASGHIPPLASDVAVTPSASESTTGANALTIGSEVSGAYHYFSGVVFNSGTSSINFVLGNVRGEYRFDHCRLKSTGTGTLSIATTGSRVVLNDTVLEFSATTGSILLSGVFEWNNTPSALTGTMPTTLFNSFGNLSVVRMNGVDLSALGSGKTIVGSPSSGSSVFLLSGVKLDSAVTIAASLTNNGTLIDLVACDDDNASGTMRHERYTVAGTQVIETTIIPTLAVNQASDGVTEVSWKIVTSTLASFTFPSEAMKIPFLVETANVAVTCKVHLVTDNVTVENDEVWIEVEYPGSAATPQMSVVSSGMLNVLSTPAAYPLSTMAWTTTGLTTPVAQEMSATFTPAQVGVCYLTVKVGRASLTTYVSPRPGLS